MTIEELKRSVDIIRMNIELRSLQDHKYRNKQRYGLRKDSKLIREGKKKGMIV